MNDRSKKMSFSKSEKVTKVKKKVKDPYVFQCTATLYKKVLLFMAFMKTAKRSLHQIQRHAQDKRDNTKVSV